MLDQVKGSKTLTFRKWAVTLALGAMAAGAAFAGPTPAPNPLGITPAQKVQMQKLEAQGNAELKASNTHGTPQEKQLRAMAIRQKYMAKATALLTSQQRAKIQATQQRMQQQMAKERLVLASLTPDQRKRVASANDQARAQAFVIFKNKSLSDAQKRAQLVRIEAARKGKMDQILTPQQKARLK